jgi:hypothetical protein
MEDFENAGKDAVGELRRYGDVLPASSPFRSL